MLQKMASTLHTIIRLKARMDVVGDIDANGKLHVSYALVADSRRAVMVLVALTGRHGEDGFRFDAMLRGEHPWDRFEP